MQKNDLLGDLAQAANKRCLSDLHRLPPDQLADIVAKMDSTRYSREQWCYALGYIYDQAIQLPADANIVTVIRLIEIA